MISYMVKRERYPLAEEPVQRQEEVEAGAGAATTEEQHCE